MLFKIYRVQYTPTSNFGYGQGNLFFFFYNYMHENAINRNVKKDRHPLDTACLMELATYKAFDKLDFRVVKNIIFPILYYYSMHVHNRSVRDIYMKF